jgi:hypothetical protein
VATKKKKKEPNTFYCRYCQGYKEEKEFYSTTDKFLDANGLMSVCKECIRKIYENFYAVDKDVYRVIYKMCKALNVLYIESAVDVTKKMISSRETMNEESGSAFGVYKSRLPSMFKAGFSDASRDMSPESFDLTFQHESPMPKTKVSNSLFGDIVDLKSFWGENLLIDDYKFLQKEYDNFKKTHRADVYSEIVLLREICFKLLLIRNLRVEGKSTAVMTKELQELMKNLGISPSMLNAANSGKSLDTFGQWVKEIEEFRPAEFFDDKDMYADFDKIEEYAERHITRPLKNFITGSRDFGVDALDLNEEIEDGEE